MLTFDVKVEAAASGHGLDASLPTPQKGSTAMSTANDFDFFHGRWNVQHRRLVQRLARCTDWQTFGGQCHNWPLLGGAGNVDDNLLDLPAGAYRAATLRSWDASARTWQIWWLDGRQPRALGEPMVGRFEEIGRAHV